MTLEQIRQLLEECLNLIIIDAKGLAEARQRCSKFLAAQALMVNYSEKLEVEISKHSAVTDVCYAQAIKTAEGKNVTEKKINAVTEPVFLKEDQKLAELKAQHTWLKAHLKILENAHIMYRQFVKE